MNPGIVRQAVDKTISFVLTKRICSHFNNAKIVVDDNLITIHRDEIVFTAIKLCILTSWGLTNVPTA